MRAANALWQQAAHLSRRHMHAGLLRVSQVVAPRRMAASSLAPIMFFVAEVAGTCSVTKSASSSTSFRVLHEIALPIAICAGMENRGHVSHKQLAACAHG